MKDQRVTCYLDGKLRFDGNFINCLLEGECVYNSGDTTLNINYKEGLIDGEFKFINGTKTLIGLFEKGKFIGMKEGEEHLGITGLENTENVVSLFGCLVTSKILYDQVLINDVVILCPATNEIDNIINKYDDNKLKYIKIAVPISYRLVYSEISLMLYLATYYRNVSDEEKIINCLRKETACLCCVKIAYKNNGVYELLKLD